MLPREKTPAITQILESSKERIASTFGKMESGAKVVVTASSDEASYFGSNDWGRAHLSAIGQCVVLGPEGRSVDIAAHELVHAEVHYRVGWIKHFLEIPVWFNEGVALIVDHREFLLPENIQLNPEDIESVKSKELDFFGDNSWKNYQAARIAVDTLDTSTLYEKLEKINKGEGFEKVFNYY